MKESRWSPFQSIRLDPNSGVRFHNLVPRHRMPSVNFFGFCFCVFCVLIGFENRESKLDLKESKRFVMAYPEDHLYSEDLGSQKPVNVT